MKREEKYPDTEYFHYYNANQHNHKVGDCVIRAIAVAEGKSWEHVFKDMCSIGLKYGYMPNDDQCIKKYLTKLGYTKMKEPRDEFNKKMSVKKFIDLKLHDSNIIANVGSHHMVAITNCKVVNDIWNSSGQTMHSYWIKEV